MSDNSVSPELERAILTRLREEAQILCEACDPLLKPQYRHLLGRIEALLDITACRAADLPENGPQ